MLHSTGLFVGLNDYGKKLSLSFTPRRRCEQPSGFQGKKNPKLHKERCYRGNPRITRLEKSYEFTAKGPDSSTDENPEVDSLDSGSEKDGPDDILLLGKEIQISRLHASCYDQRLPAASLMNDKHFWMTTGMYPQSVVFDFEAATRLLGLELTCSEHVRIMTVSCAKQSHCAWQEIATIDFDDSCTRSKYHHHKLHFAARRITCQALRLSIDRAFGDFSVVKSVRLVGVVA